MVRNIHAVVRRYCCRTIRTIGLEGIFALIFVLAGIFIIIYCMPHPLMPVVGLCLFAVGLCGFMIHFFQTSWHTLFLLIFFSGVIFTIWYNPYNKKLENISNNISTANSQIEELKGKVKELLEVKNKQSSKTVPAEKPPTSLVPVQQIANCYLDRQSVPTVDSSDDIIFKRVEFILTFIGVIIAALALFLAKKIERLFEMEKQLGDASRLAISTAEIALANLPDFTESHQISYDSYKVLETIDNIIFHPESEILKFLNKTRNGVKLRFARAIKLFADGNYECVIDELEEIIKNCNCKTDIDTYTYLQALYRLGITYRQLDKWADSINAFCKLHKFGDDRNKIKAKYGIALTLFALSKQNNFEDQDKQKINECLNSISKPHVNILPDCKRIAGELIEEVLIKHPFHYSAILFNVLIPSTHKLLPIKVNEIQDDKSRAIVQERLNILIRFLEGMIPESLNIRANYFVVEALAQYSLGNIERAEIALERAESTTKTYIEIVSENHTIFSDIKIKQIKAKEFLEEIKEIKKAMEKENKNNPRSSDKTSRCGFKAFINAMRLFFCHMGA